MLIWNALALSSLLCLPTYGSEESESGKRQSKAALCNRRCIKVVQKTSGGITVMLRRLICLPYCREKGMKGKQNKTLGRSRRELETSTNSSSSLPGAYQYETVDGKVQGVTGVSVCCSGGLMLITWNPYQLHQKKWNKYRVTFPHMTDDIFDVDKKSTSKYIQLNSNRWICRHEFYTVVNTYPSASNAKDIVWPIARPTKCKEPTPPAVQNTSSPRRPTGSMSVAVQNTSSPKRPTGTTEFPSQWQTAVQNTSSPKRPTGTTEFPSQWQTEEAQSKPSGSMSVDTVKGLVAAGTVCLVILMIITIFLTWRCWKTTEGRSTTCYAPKDCQKSYMALYYPESESYVDKIASVVNKFRALGYDMIMDKMATVEISSMGPNKWSEVQIQKAKKVVVFVSPGYIKVCNEEDKNILQDSTDQIRQTWYEIRLIKAIFCHSFSASKIICVQMDQKLSGQRLPPWAEVTYCWPDDIDKIVMRLNDTTEIEPAQVMIKMVST